MSPTRSLRPIVALATLAVVALAAGCSSSATTDPTSAPANATFEIRPVVFVGNTADTTAIPTDAAALGDLGLPAGDDAVAAANWAAAGNCDAERVSTPDVEAACSADGTAIYLLGTAALDRSNITSVEDEPDQGSGDTMTMTMTLDDAGAAAFQDLTGKISKLDEPRNHVAIVFDGKVLSDPAVTEALAGQQVQMAGGSDDPALKALVASFSN